MKAESLLLLVATSVNPSGFVSPPLSVISKNAEAVITSVMLPDTVYIIESDNFILNTFQAFLFTYFKQKRQFLYHYRLFNFKLSQGVNKLDNHH